RAVIAVESITPAASRSVDTLREHGVVRPGGRRNGIRQSLLQFESDHAVDQVPPIARPDRRVRGVAETRASGEAVRFEQMHELFTRVEVPRCGIDGLPLHTTLA